MKPLKLLFAGIATIMSGGVAQPADVAQPRVAKAPSATPMPAFSWTGCHVGVHGGWAKGDQAVNARSDGIVDLAGNGDVHSEGGFFGGQLGCDYQSNGWVVGLAGDVAALNIDGQIPNPLNLGIPGQISAETQWIASVTGRIGFAELLPRTLVYVKGGGAWTRQAYSLGGFGAVALNSDFSKTFSGWTAGGGIAWAFAEHWSLFVEYNHYDFSGSFSNSAAVVPSVYSINIDAPRIDTVKAGLNLRF